MNENDNENINSTNDNAGNEEEVVVVDLDEETEEAKEESPDEETIKISKKEWTEALAQKEHWKKKATTKSEAKEDTAPQLSTKDLYALTKANVDEDDIDEVIEFAKFKKISVAEAVKSPVVKSILSERVEKRNVANASNTGTQRRASTKLTDEALVQNASKGQLPDSDEELARLWLARKGKK